MDREPDHNLDYVAGRLDGVLDALVDVKNGQQDLSRRIDYTNERIDSVSDSVNERIDLVIDRMDKINGRIDKLILALLGIGGALVVAVIAGVIALRWAILRAG